MTATKTEQQTLQYLDPADIAPHPKNPRHSLGDLRELTASITEHGVLEPLVVEPFTVTSAVEGYRWQLIHGHRRLAAAQAAGLELVPVMVQPTASLLEEQVARMLVENLQRAGLTAVERATPTRSSWTWGGTRQRSPGGCLARSGPCRTW